MGTWGVDNFANDGALDFVGGLVDSLQKRVENIFEEDRASLDEDGEAALVPSVSIITLLCERCGAAPPTAEVVCTWRERYLRIYDAQIDGLLPDPQSDYKPKRRRVIEETFAALEKRSREFWKD
jgi:hypothetical protein